MVYFKEHSIKEIHQKEQQLQSIEQSTENNALALDAVLTEIIPALTLEGVSL